MLLFTWFCALNDRTIRQYSTQPNVNCFNKTCVERQYVIWLLSMMRLDSEQQI